MKTLRRHAQASRRSCPCPEWAALQSRFAGAGGQTAAVTGSGDLCSIRGGPPIIAAGSLVCGCLPLGASGNPDARPCLPTFLPTCPSERLGTVVLRRTARRPSGRPGERHGASRTDGATTVPRRPPVSTHLSTGPAETLRSWAETGDNSGGQNVADLQVLCGIQTERLRRLITARAGIAPRRSAVRFRRAPSLRTRSELSATGSYKRVQRRRALASPFPPQRIPEARGGDWVVAALPSDLQTPPPCSRCCAPSGAACPLAGCSP